MGFFNTISDWFNNTIIKATYDPGADALKSLYRQNVTQNILGLQNTVSGLGGGLGAAIVSIPGVGTPIINGLNALKKESEDILAKAQTMTPDQIAAANDSINQKYQQLLAQAQAEGTAPPPPPSTNPIAEAEYSINDFFNTIFSTTMYIIIFFVVLFLGLLGSSLASNAMIDKPIAYRIYYMIYGFILFPIPLIQGIFRYFNKEKLFYAIWAPLHKGYTNSSFYNLLLYPFIYTDIAAGQVSNFSASSLVVNPLETLTTPPVAPVQLDSQPQANIPSELQTPEVPIDLKNSFGKISFEPTRVRA